MKAEAAMVRAMGGAAVAQELAERWAKEPDKAKGTRIGIGIGKK